MPPLRIRLRLLTQRGALAAIFHHCREEIMTAETTALPDLSAGNCVGRSDVFDPLPPNHPDREDRQAEALQLCRTCPVLLACRRWYLATPRDQRPVGIVTAGRVNHDRKRRQR